MKIKVLNELRAESALSKVSNDIQFPIDFGFVGSLLTDSVVDGEEDTLKGIMVQISTNFKNIYALNPGSHIYALSIYVPTSVVDDLFIVETINYKRYAKNMVHIIFLPLN